MPRRLLSPALFLRPFLVMLAMVLLSMQALAQADPTPQQTNDPEEQFQLGKKYEKGDGVAQDYDKALWWYRRAAEQRNPKAQRRICVF